MDRRTFFKGLAGLLALPFLPEIKSKRIVYYGNSIHLRHEFLTEFEKSPSGLGLPPIKSEGRSFCYDNHQPTKLLIRKEWEKDALEILRTTYG